MTAKRAPSPCSLALTLLAFGEFCPACGYQTEEHEGWCREVRRGAVPSERWRLEEPDGPVRLDALEEPRAMLADGASVERYPSKSGGPIGAPVRTLGRAKDIPAERVRFVIGGRAFAGRTRSAAALFDRDSGRWADEHEGFADAVEGAPVAFEAGDVVAVDLTTGDARAEPVRAIDLAREAVVDSARDAIGMPHDDPRIDALEKAITNLDALAGLPPPPAEDRSPAPPSAAPSLRTVENSRALDGDSEASEARERVSKKQTPWGSNR